MAATAALIVLVSTRFTQGVVLAPPATPKSEVLAEVSVPIAKEEDLDQLNKYTSNKDQAQQFKDTHDQKALDDFVAAREAAESQENSTEVTPGESEQRDAWLKDLENEMKGHEAGDVQFPEGAETSSPPRDEHSPEAQKAYEASGFAKKSNSIMKMTLAAAMKHFGPVTATTFKKALGLLPAWAFTEAEKYIPVDENFDATAQGEAVDAGLSLNKFGVNRAKNGVADASGTRCQTVTVQPQFQLNQYVSAPWYSVKQLELFYQPTDQLYCVRAQYLPRGMFPGQLNGRGQGFFLPSYWGNAASRALMNWFSTIWGWQIFVSNQANSGGYSGRQAETLGFLCGRKKSTWPGYGEDAKLRVAPCFLPPSFAGNYWVIYHNESYQGVGAAIIVGGQPDRRTGNGRLCDYRAGGGGPADQGGRGMWFFSRQPVVNQAFKDGLMTILNDKGLDGSEMLDVDHGTTNFASCSYGRNHKNANDP